MYGHVRVYSHIFSKNFTYKNIKIQHGVSVPSSYHNETLIFDSVKFLKLSNFSSVMQFYSSDI